MIEVNDYIREKLREAREAAGLSQRQLAELVHSAQGTISDLERGKIRINAGELVRYAQALGKSILYFYPGTQVSDLSEREQVLVSLFQRLEDRWQENLIELAAAQVRLQETVLAKQQSEDDAKIVEHFSELADQRFADEIEYWNHIEDEFAQGRIVVLSPGKERELGEPLTADNLIDAVSRGLAGTRQDAAIRTALEKRFLELWREGRVAWRDPRAAQVLKLDLDREPDALKAWEWGQVVLKEVES
jgi:transcriptional regulator with XRE-family HTH domain